MNKLNLFWFDFKNLLKSFFEKTYFRIFISIFIFGLVIFCPFTLFNFFTLPMNGDYVLQQIPFYENIHDTYWHFFRTGEFNLWSYQNFIGANFFAASTFYNLTSPFTILYILTPKSFIPQMIFISMIIKMATGGLFFYILLNKFYKVSNKISYIGAMIYAFSGWGMFNLWFHYADVLAIFPLTLIGAEYLILKKKGWLLTLTIVIMGFTNYYFLFTFAITNPLYIFFRTLATKENFKVKIQTLFKGALYFIAAILISGIILLPAYQMISLSPRMSQQNFLIQFLNYFYQNAYKDNNGIHLGNLKSIGAIFSKNNLFGYTNSSSDYVKGLFEFVFRFNKIKEYFYPISGFFFINIANWDTLLISNNYFDNMISNMFITTPLTLLLIPSFISSIKKKKVLDIIIFILLVILPFVPITYYALHAFSIPYGRWQIFLMAMALIYTIKKLDTIETLTLAELLTSFTITLFIMIFAIYYTHKLDYLNSYRLLIALGQVAYVIIIFTVYYTKDKNKQFTNTILYLAMVELLISGVATTLEHGYTKYSDLYGGQHKLKEQQKIIKYINSDLKDSSFYRIYNDLADRNNVNLPMILNYKGLSTFHSSYQYQISDFINFAKINYTNGNWSMGVHEKRIYLETFLNVKYYILNNDSSNVNLPSDYQKLKCWTNYCLYLNPHHLELGYSYDTVMNKSGFNSYDDYGRRTLSLDQSYLQFPVIDSSEFAEVVSEINPTEVTFMPTYNNYYLKYQYYRYDNDTGEYQEPLSIVSAPYNNDIKNYQINYFDILEGTPNPAIPENSIIYLNLPFGPNSEVSLLALKSNVPVSEQINYNCDEMYCTITTDSHMIHWYDKSDDHKYARGFYSKFPISKVQIKMLEDSNKITYLPQISQKSYSNYINTTTNLKKYPLENIIHSNNNISFTTSYDSKRFILLSIPYDKGWTVKVNNKKVKTYSVTGGFLGFISGAGETTYDLSYYTPGLKAGINFTLYGGMLLLGLILFEERKRILSFLKK